MGQSSPGESRVLHVMAAKQEYGPELRRRIRPLVTGVGVIEAAICTSIRLKELADAGTLPHLVISLGSAASRRCAVGTVWQVASVSWRDMDASRLGFERGVTPFADHGPFIQLPTPVVGLPTASLSSGSTVVGGAELDAIRADLVDMETFAVVRACGRFNVPVIGLRGVSDGPGDLTGLGGWTEPLAMLDAALARAIDRIPSDVVGGLAGP